MTARATAGGAAAGRAAPGGGAAGRATPDRASGRTASGRTASGRTVAGRASPAFDAQLRRLHDLADQLVGSWAESAAATITAGQERALLRLLGVNGLDTKGRPLAAEVVDRWLAGGAGRLGQGIALPVAIALLEYDSTPQSLALDVASGAIDLGFEAELLVQPGPRAAAEAEARRLVASSLERIDANRLARRELIAMLGEAPRPWLRGTLSEPVAAAAAAEARAAVRAGADVVRVEVPSGRELAVRLRAVGVKVKAWQPGGREDGDSSVGTEIAPAGSQRGLAVIRAAVDAAAAESGRYARVALAVPALSAPETAVVAALERLDLVESDPMEEIAATGVDPGRALADHGFARRLLRRAGAAIMVGASPLVVTPELVRGVPSAPAGRSGRGLALQLLSARLAIAQGLPADGVLLGALPAWLLDERHGPSLAAAEVAVRRALLPGHPLAFIEPPDAAPSGPWPFLIGALLPPAPAGGLVARSAPARAFAPVAAATRAAASVAAELATAVDLERLEGPALDHATATLTAAVEVLEALGSTGWQAILDDGTRPPGGEGGWVGRGADSAARRTDSFDPLGEVLAGA